MAKSKTARCCTISWNTPCFSPAEVVERADVLADLGPGSGLVAVEAAEICLARCAAEKAGELARGLLEVPDLAGSGYPNDSQQHEDCLGLLARAGKVLLEVGDAETARKLLAMAREIDDSHRVGQPWGDTVERLWEEAEER